MKWGRESGKGTASGAAEPVGRGRVRAFLGTELSRVIPLSRRSPATWVGALEQAGLPPAVDGAVREIVRRTRLWGGEKLDVTRELVAHAKDGLESGTDPDRLASAMGEPRKVARLIRRAMKRKRHWLWHTRVWLFRGTGAAAGLVLLVAGVMTARFFIGDPRPTRNFIAEMNAPFLKYSEDERSWPGLRNVNVAIAAAEDAVLDDMLQRAHERAESGDLTQEQLALKFDTPGLDLKPSIDRRHPDYAEVVGMVRELGSSLARSRELASRPIVGMGYSTKWPVDTDWESKPKGWIDDPLPDTEGVAEQDLLIGVLLPWLSPIRGQCRWLALDARVAADEGDAGRAEADVDAILGFARQVNRDQILISNLVALACTDLARVTLGRVMLEHPGLLGREQLVGLAHRLGESRAMFESLPLTWDINMFEDVLQRAYTDDGHGDGHLTNEGIEMLTMLSSLSSGSNTTVGDNVKDMVRAADTVFLSSRADLLREYLRAMELLREDESKGYEIFRGRAMESEQWVEEHRGGGVLDPVSMLLPALGRAVITQAIGRARIDGTLVSIAATLHKLDTGAWPAGVSELVPRYLPAVPEDPFTGGPMLLGEDGDGGLIVYCTGPDLDDDGGTTIGSGEQDLRPDAYGAAAPKANGDWVLFPPSE